MSKESPTEIAASAMDGIRERLDLREEAAMTQAAKVAAAIDAFGDELEARDDEPWPISESERRQRRRRIHAQASNELIALITAITDITQRSTLDPIAVAVADLREREHSASVG